VAAVTVWALVAVPAAASPAPSRPASSCERPVLLLHDMASSGREWDALAAEARAAGLCVFTPTYGANAVTTAVAGVAPIAGLIRIEDSAIEFRTIVDSVLSETGARDVRVIAHGAGGLVAAYYLKHLDPRRGGGPTVTSLVTLGPLWGGTDIAGFATVGDFNKRLGIYKPLEALEKPLVEPFCAGCRQLIAHSDFMTELAEGGYLTPGVDYADIITTHDLLMSDPLGAVLPGSTAVVLQNIDAANASNHFQLADDPLTRRLALSALPTK
jgi:triacylglycerol esterase/lipase EstA (alpha/beta hydrolase family)